MSGNGHIIEAKKPSLAGSLTFKFGDDGELANVDGSVSLQQLLIIAFEATNLAQGVRASVQMQNAMAKEDIRRVTADLAKERGLRGR